MAWSVDAIVTHDVDRLSPRDTRISDTRHTIEMKSA